MAKANRWQKALTVMVRGGVISPEDLCKEMQYDSVYRVSAVVLDTKIYAGAVVKPHRDGRKVIGYELINIDEMVKFLGDKGITSTGVVKTPKASKSKKTAVAPVVAQEADPIVKSGPVDVLDEIDTSITDFEDREFAEGFVEGRV